MSHSKDQILLINPDFDTQDSNQTRILLCCICRNEILEDDSVSQCPSCQTSFHSKHLSLWLDFKRTCPICGCFLYRSNNRDPKRGRGKGRMRTGKSYRCYYCNHKWDTYSFGYPLWCPECGITSCPQCNTAFGFEFLLGHLQSNGSCPNCNRHISIESLKAKIKFLEID
jgi:hypothetical protein